MDLVIVPICFGGGWKTENDECKYVGGDVTTKAFVLEERFNLESLKEKIVERFKLSTQPTDIYLSHLHPSKKLPTPFTIESDDDLQSFYLISSTPKVDWGLTLYVITYSRRKGKEPAIPSTQIVKPPSTVTSSYLLPSNDRSSNQPLVISEVNDAPPNSSDEDNPLAIEYPPDQQYVQVGQMYQSKEELKTAMYNHAMKQSYCFKVNRSRSDYYSLKCVDDNCEWKMVATRLKGLTYFEVKKFNDTHTCPFEVRCTRHIQPSYQHIGEKIKLR